MRHLKQSLVRILSLIFYEKFGLVSTIFFYAVRGVYKSKTKFTVHVFISYFFLFFCTFQEDIVTFKSLFKQYKLIFEASDVDNRIVELLISTIQMFRICVVKHNHEARREQKRITRIEVICIFFSELPEGTIY